MPALFTSEAAPPGPEREEVGFASRTRMPTPIISEICAAGGIVRMEPKLAGGGGAICLRHVLIPVVPSVRQTGDACPEPIAPPLTKAAIARTAPPIDMLAAAKAASTESMGSTRAEAARAADTKTAAQSTTPSEAATKAAPASEAATPEAVATTSAKATTVAATHAAAAAAAAATASHEDHGIIARAVSGARRVSRRWNCGAYRQRRA
jgi:hypothetical protein